MEFFSISKTEVLKKLNVNGLVGINESEVDKRKKVYGENVFSQERKVSLLKKILEALKEPMIFILIVAAVISISINIYNYYKGNVVDFTESVGIVVAIIISSGIKVLMEGRSEKAFEELNNITEDLNVKVIRDGSVQYVAKKDIVVGDIIKVETGDKIPADARLLEALQLEVDESALTGESINVSKNPSLTYKEYKTTLSERRNMIYAGSFVTYGKATAIVIGVGDNTEMGSIAQELKKNIMKSTPLQEKLDKLAKGITLLGIIAASLIFIYEIVKIALSNNLNFDSIQNAFMTSVALIVASVPEGLPTIVAITLALNIIKMARNNALVRKLIACETIGCINVICSDKTGTLTKNKMTVVDVWNNGKLIKPEELKNSYMLENFALNSTADILSKDGLDKFIGNPTECSLLTAFSKTVCPVSSEKCPHYNNLCEGKCKKYIFNKKEKLSYKDIREGSSITFQYPFSSDKKSMTTIIDKGREYRVYTKGSPEKIIGNCNKIIINNKISEFDDKYKKDINEEIIRLEKQAKRIIAFSHKQDKIKRFKVGEGQDEIEQNMIFDGFVAITDPLREEVYESVKRCNNSGISLKILTGDNIVTATTIAKELDILDDKSMVLESSEIDELSDDELLKMLDNIKVIARSTPNTKMRIVNLLKRRGNIVAVTGDGINDAPALKNADVGIAMGVTGTEVSKEASDIILLNDSFSTIVKAVEWGRGIYENFQRFIQFQLTVNIVAVLTVFLCEVLDKELPFTTIQLLWVNLIMDGPPALSLGLESLRNHLMEQSPTKRDDSIITKNMLFRIVINGIFMVIMMMLLINNNPLNGIGAEEGSIVFTTFVIFQLFNSFNCRELGDESLFKNLLKNKPMLVIIGGTCILQIIITQFGGGFFRTVPLSFKIWIQIFIYSFSIIVFSEMIRFIKRKIKR